jgi:uncharacterized protein
VILLDVNVLIGAFRTDSPHYAVCNPWLTDVLAGDPVYCLSPLTLSAVVRITTNSKSHKVPSTLQEAFSFCDYLRSQPNCQIVEPGERHWDIFKRLCAETGIRGPDVTDAWFAALAIEWGCEWITLDRGFSRFPGLRWSMPSALRR